MQPKGTHIQQPPKGNWIEVKGECTTVQVFRLYPVKSPLMTRNEIAGLLNVTPQVITQRAKSGQIKRVNIGGVTVYPADLNRLENYIMVVP